MTDSIADQLTQLHNQAMASVQTASSLEELSQIRNQLFNRKKGTLTTILKGLKDMDPEERKLVGSQANQIKGELEQLLDTRTAALQAAHSAIGTFDTTLPATPVGVGSIHPLRRVQQELTDIFSGMGFNVYEGNELENELYCFEYLNIPDTHPARDLQDTFYITQPDADGNTQVLRTHTSNMQVRIMQELKPPFRAVVPGRVFRNEALDATHEHTFYQMEGFVVGENITIANLTYVLKTAMSKILERDIKIRLRPGYFPYVEPGFEADCSTEDGKWLEMLGCGMIHPKVFEAAGYEPGKYTGFAFGMGINRLAMMKYGIADVRNFMSGDLRVLDQF